MGPRMRRTIVAESHDPAAEPPRYFCRNCDEEHEADGTEVRAGSEIFCSDVCRNTPDCSCGHGAHGACIECDCLEYEPHEGAP